MAKRAAGEPAEGEAMMHKAKKENFLPRAWPSNVCTPRLNEKEFLADVRRRTRSKSVIGLWPGSRRSCCGARWCGFRARSVGAVAARGRRFAQLSRPSRGSGICRSRSGCGSWYLLTLYSSQGLGGAL
jgi:hypothetical protein